MTVTAKAKLLATDAGVTFEQLLDFSSFMSARDEDLFWRTVNEIRGYQY